MQGVVWLSATLETAVSFTQGAAWGRGLPKLEMSALTSATTPLALVAQRKSLLSSPATRHGIEVPFISPGAEMRSRERKR